MIPITGRTAGTPRRDGDRATGITGGTIEIATVGTCCATGNGRENGTKNAEPDRIRLQRWTRQRVKTI
jgi:hypothetical protein